MWLFLLTVLLTTLYLFTVLPSIWRWKRQGVPASWPIPLLGNFAPVFLRRKTVFATIQQLIQPVKEKGYRGLFMFQKPMLMIWDPEMAKQVLAKDFSSFHDHGLPYDEADPLSATLFCLEGAKWRKLRNKLTPTFTSGKLKLMYPLVKDVARGLSDALLEDAKSNGGSVELSSLLARYATDVIGTCAFGIECNSLKTKDDRLSDMVQEVMTGNIGQWIRMILAAIHPSLARLMPLNLVFPEAHRFFLNFMRDTVEYREKNNVVRNDFVHLLMQLRETDRAEPNPDNRIDVTTNLMTAQAFFFFTAGMDNIAITVSFCIHQLAFNEDIQRRAAAEVRDVVRAHDGQLSYEALQKMDLVERIIMEGLRMWPPLAGVVRQCNRTCTVGDLVIEKGDSVTISVKAMHNDPNNFPDPTRFDPDRFTGEQASLRHPFAYLPFGAGPRMCIAERFAMIEMKIALASLLTEFHFSPCSRTENIIQLDVTWMAPRPLNGFWVQANLRA